jgi:hypothetical protein
VSPQEQEHLKAAVAVKMTEIRKQHFDAGLPIVYAKDGWVVKEYKDGRIVKIQKIQEHGRKENLQW